MKHVKFEQSPDMAKGIGNYYSLSTPTYGEGWFGSAEKVSFYFETKLASGEWLHRIKRTAEGCKWTDWS